MLTYGFSSPRRQALLQLPPLGPVEPQNIFGFSGRSVKALATKAPINDADRLLSRRSTCGPTLETWGAQFALPAFVGITSEPDLISRNPMQVRLKSLNLDYTESARAALLVEDAGKSSVKWESTMHKAEPHPHSDLPEGLLPRPRLASAPSQSEDQGRLMRPSVSLPGLVPPPTSPNYESPSQSPPGLIRSVPFRPNSVTAVHPFAGKYRNKWDRLALADLRKTCFQKELPRPVTPQEPDPADFRPRPEPSTCTTCRGSGKAKGQEKDCERCQGAGECVRGREHKDAERERRAWHKFFQDLMHINLPDQLIVDFGLNRKQGPTKERILEAFVMYYHMLVDLNHLEGKEIRSLDEKNSALKEDILSVGRALDELESAYENIQEDSAKKDVLIADLSIETARKELIVTGLQQESARKDVAISELLRLVAWLNEHQKQLGASIRGEAEQGSVVMTGNQGNESHESEMAAIHRWLTSMLSQTHVDATSPTKQLPRITCTLTATCHIQDSDSTSPSKRRKRTHFVDHHQGVVSDTFEDDDRADSWSVGDSTSSSGTTEITPTRSVPVDILPSSFSLRTALSECGSNNGTDSSWNKLSSANVAEA